MVGLLRHCIALCLNVLFRHYLACSTHPKFHLYLVHVHSLLKTHRPNLSSTITVGFDFNRWY